MARLDLQNDLEDILGTRNVYFQPPEGFRLSYPCIIYELSSEKATYADNDPYIFMERYTVTLIEKTPNTAVRKKLRQLRTASFSRFFKSDNLYHYVYNMYY